MAELLNLANNFQTDMNFITPPQRLMLITQLTDRFIRWDEHLRSHEIEGVHYEYQYQYELEHHIEKKDDPDYPHVDDHEDLQPTY